MKTRVGVTAALLSALLGCASPPRAYSRPAGAYGDALEQSTRSVAVYDQLNQVFFAYATHESDDFRQARAERLSALTGLPAAAAVERVAELASEPDGIGFVVAIHTAERGVNTLDRPGGGWVLSLTGDEGRVTASQVRRLHRADAEVRGLYPYADPFFVLYRVTFPLAVGKGPLTLVLAGPAGEARLSF